MDKLKFKGSYDYYFVEIDRNDDYILYEQRDEDDDRFVCYEIHKRFASGNKWWKSPRSIARARELMNTKKGNYDNRENIGIRSK